nr:hypothetical protein [Butyrivibrio sp.]
EQHDDRYFCSQFVSEVLRDSGCVDIGTLPANCTPNDLLKELEKSGQILYSEVEATIENPVSSFLDKAAQKTGAVRDMASPISDKIGSVLDNAVATLENGKAAIESAPQKIAKKTSSIVKKGSELTGL